MNDLRDPIVPEEFQVEEGENEDPLAPKPWEIHETPYVILHVKPEVLIDRCGELLVSCSMRPSSSNNSRRNKAKLVTDSVRQRNRRGKTDDLSTSQLSSEDALKSIAHRQCKVLLKRLNVRDVCIDHNSNFLHEALELKSKRPSNDKKRRSTLRSGKRSPLEGFNSCSDGSRGGRRAKRIKSQTDSGEPVSLNRSLRGKLKQLSSDRDLSCPKSSPAENLSNNDDNETAESLVDSIVSRTYPLRQKSNNAIKRSTSRTTKRNYRNNDLKSSLDDACSNMKECCVLLEKIPIEDLCDERISQFERRRIIKNLKEKSLKWVEELKKRNADICSVKLSTRNQPSMESIEISPSKKPRTVQSSSHKCHPFPLIFIKDSVSLNTTKSRKVIPKEA